jgi:hypothetical protein
MAGRRARHVESPVTARPEVSPPVAGHWTLLSFHPSATPRGARISAGASHGSHPVAAHADSQLLRSTTRRRVLRSVTPAGQTEGQSQTKQHTESERRRCYAHPPAPVPQQSPSTAATRARAAGPPALGLERSVMHDTPRALPPRAENSHTRSPRDTPARSPLLPGRIATPSCSGPQGSERRVGTGAVSPADRSTTFPF